MNSAQGFIEIECAGHKLPCKFGMNAFYLFTEMRGIKAGELNEAMQNKQDLTVMRDLTWAGIDAACKSKGIENPVNVYQVGDMLDEADQQLFQQLTNALKNSQVLGQSLNQNQSADPKKKK